MVKNLAKVFSAELEGVSSRPIEVEVDMNIGLYSFNIVGLADKAVSEAKERVSSALKNSGTKPPSRENRKITVNLAPADLKKTGSQHDLAIAVGYLLSSNQIADFETRDKIFVGELSLNGDLKRISGALNICRMAREKLFKEVYLPESNNWEASLVEGIKIFPVKNIKSLILHLEDKQPINPLVFSKPDLPSRRQVGQIDISDIKGQESAKRAMIIAAAGSHNIFMSGPPGGGKTMLARSIISILPELSFEEALEIAEVYSAAGQAGDNSLIFSRPFRSPHHSASLVSIVGGGQDPKPGEISLAHRGVLFLDELPEFKRDVLEALRQPLEDGSVSISRSKKSLSFPSKFMLVASANPCPCGFYGDEEKDCRCSAYDVLKYRKKISGPLLDRVDIQIFVGRVKSKDLSVESGTDVSQEIRNKINQSRQVQNERFEKNKLKIFSNSELSSKQVQEIVRLSPSARKFINSALDKNQLSARGYFKVLKLAQTIADLESKETVDDSCVAEAFSYRVRKED